VFATACALWGLAICGSLGPGDDLLGSAVERLLDQQDRDGGWGPSAALRIPPPACSDADAYPSWKQDGYGVGSIVLDQHRLYTTATVLEALRLSAGRVAGTGPRTALS
jgi:hypothetical protein